MKERGLHLFVLLFFSLFTFLLFWPIFLGKVNLNGHLLVSFYAIYGENLPFKDTGWDQLRIYFPFYKITLDALRQFSLPFWTVFIFPVPSMIPVNIIKNPLQSRHYPQTV